MDLVVPRTDEHAHAAAPPAQCPREQNERSAGVAAGINIAPGSDDDGWIVPDPVPLDDGTLVQLYKDGEALRAAYRAIEQARRRVCLEVYIFADDDTGRAFAELLCRKAIQGVQVYVIYDSFGSLGTDRQMLRQMQRSGVHLEVFHPVYPWECRYSWRPFNRDHRKLLVIDDEIAGLGGLNVGHEYAGSWVIYQRDADECDFWRDNAIGIRGPMARYFLRAFARSWHYVTHGGRIRTAEFNYNLEAIHNGAPRDPGNQMSILASVPTLSSPLRPLLRSLFANARHSIQMTMAYFAPDDELIAELCRAARRGVRVQLMLPARCDVHALIIAARSFYETLLSAGVEIYERQTVVLHAKTMTIDGAITVIGSANLDYRSIEYNLELSAIIHSRQFGQQMHALFANDMLYARRISLSEWRKRPMRDRLVQWAVSRARYLL
ncbi:phospholipase D-like domain-containing protein [Fontivita pretiosa]|uniref:phospholipase D-like domain-containing protein n=1 Tax=Fontivita pretiosa TaxID=2989684 RepID=UPI003D186976